jgi:hypothetical protein
MLTDIGKESSKLKGLYWGKETKGVKDNFETAAIHALPVDV